MQGKDSNKEKLQITGLGIDGISKVNISNVKPVLRLIRCLPPPEIHPELKVSLKDFNLN